MSPNVRRPVQLRLGFEAHGGPIILSLSLTGLTINVETADASLANSYLKDAGAEPTFTNSSLTFPSANITALAKLPEQVTVTSELKLRPLVDVVRAPSDTQHPCEITKDPDGSLLLKWWDGKHSRSDYIHPDLAGPFLISQVPFVATPDALEELRSQTPIPISLGQAHVNHDGFVEIHTSVPQMVENAALPGMFRLDDTRFGLALPYANAITNNPGFSWIAGPPQLDTGPTTFPALPVQLSTHAATDLSTLVENLASYRAQAVVWSAGLGRRVFSLAAIDTLDAWPLLIVCSPATVWAWLRHLALFGRDVSLTHDEADAQLVTYDELTTRRPPTSPQTIIFDDIGTPGALTPQTLAALRRLDVATDAYRLALSSTWPETIKAAATVMSVLRPGEFTTTTPHEIYYPGDATQSFNTHARAYISSRTKPEEQDTPNFPRSSILHVNPTEQQKEAFIQATTRHGHTAPAALLAEALEIASAGSAYALSPKIAATALAAQKTLKQGHRVAILTRHPKTITLLKTMLRTRNAEIVEAGIGKQELGKGPEQLTFIRYDREIPNLRNYDDVYVVDIPWSWELLDQAVGAPFHTNVPKTVTVVHLTDSIDDKIAILAARRRQLGAVLEQSAPPDGSEMNYILEDLRNNTL